MAATPTAASDVSGYTAECVPSAPYNAEASSVDVKEGEADDGFAGHGHGVGHAHDGHDDGHKSCCDDHGKGEGHGHLAHGDDGHDSGHKCCGDDHGKAEGHGHAAHGHEHGHGHGHSDASSLSPAATSFTKPSRELLLTFLSNGKAVMESKEVREMLKEPTLKRHGQKLIEMQRAQWDALGIDRDFGCNCLDRLQEDFPGDQELLSARMEFVRACERTFLRGFVDRAPDTLEEKKSMPRNVILDFFDACNTQMNLPEFQDRLIKHIVENKSVPNQIIVDMQRGMLEIFGFEKEHGCRQLSAIGTNFPKDMELHKSFQMWQHTAQATCVQLVKTHMKTGGDFVGDMFGDNPHMKSLQSAAKEQLDTMTPQERGQLLSKMQKKISIFAQLPPEAREAHMKKMPKDDQIEFVKAQILLVSVMKQQWQQEQQSTNQQACPHHGQSEHSHVQHETPEQSHMTPVVEEANSSADSNIRQRTASKPAQQMMM